MWAWPTEMICSVSGRRWLALLKKGSSAATSQLPRCGKYTFMCLCFCLCGMIFHANIFKKFFLNIFAWMFKKWQFTWSLSLHQCVRCVLCCCHYFPQTIDNEGRHYECDLMPLMEVGSVAHKYYLLNIRLPVNDREKINVGIGEIKDIQLVVSRPHNWADRFLQRSIVRK